MRKGLIIMAAGAALVTGLSTTAQAANGCGPGWHRNEHGRCRPDHYYHPSNNPYAYYGYPPAVVVEPEVRGYYPDQGYWDGDRRYWHRHDEDYDWDDR
jgi:hypothetical protein